MHQWRPLSRCLARWRRWSRTDLRSWSCVGWTAPAVSATAGAVSPSLASAASSTDDLTALEAGGVSLLVAPTPLVRMQAVGCASRSTPRCSTGPILGALLSAKSTRVATPRRNRRPRVRA